MSKKNKKSTKRNQHAFDLQREQQQKEKLQKQQEKAERKAPREGAVSGGVVKRKSKGVRIRKGVTLRGIKVVDSESKKKVLKLLKAEQRAKTMDMDQPAAKAGRKRRSAIAKPLKIGKGRKAAQQAGAAEAMET